MEVLIDFGGPHPSHHVPYLLVVIAGIPFVKQDLGTLGESTIVSSN